MQSFPVNNNKSNVIVTNHVKSFDNRNDRYLYSISTPDTSLQTLLDTINGNLFVQTISLVVFHLLVQTKKPRLLK